MLNGNTNIKLMVKLVATVTILMCTSILPAPVVTMAEDNGIESKDFNITTGQAVNLLDKEEFSYNKEESNNYDRPYESEYDIGENVKSKADTKELKKLYDSNKKREKCNYTDESWQVFVEALNYAGDLVNDINAAQYEIDAAEAQLKEAVLGLKEDAKFIKYKNELEDLYNANKNRIQGNYTDESWAVFRNALKNATDILHKENASVEEIYNAKIKLETAVLCLSKNNISAVDKTGLINLYNINKNKTQSSYTDQSFEIFKAALSNASNIINDINASQEDVNNAAEQLKKAVSGLKENNVSKVVDKKDLTDLFNENRTRSKGNYTNESWNIFILALSNANTNIHKTDVTQEDVDNASAQLKAAIEGLEESDSSNVDKSNLTTLYNKYRGKSKGNYTDDSWGKFVAALSYVNSVICNSNATQDDVKNAESRLESAVNDLKKGDSSSVDKSYLRTLYDDNKNKTKGNYTDSSWSCFTSALSNASYVLNSSNATQSEIDNAESRLDSAIDGLRKKSDSNGDKTSLQNLYNENKSRTKGNNSDSSWSSFSLALNYAYSVINNSSATSSEISTAESRLKSAVNNLTSGNSSNVSSGSGSSGGGSGSYGSNHVYSSNGGYSVYNTNSNGNSVYSAQNNVTSNNSSVLNNAIKKLSNGYANNSIKRKENVVTQNGKVYEVNVVTSPENNEVKVLKSDADDRITINAASDADVYVFISQLDKYMKIQSEKNNAAMQFDTVQDSIYAVSSNMSSDDIVNSGWNKNDGWYYINENGKAKTGWFKDNDEWYKTDSQGLMQTGWSKDGDTWYYLDGQSGAMKTGWQLLNGKWYYLQDGGAMQTGWVCVNDNWYYMNSDGAMKTGWFKDTNNNWYYLKSNGAMAKNEIIDGYYINENGAWA